MLMNSYLPLRKIINIIPDINYFLNAYFHSIFYKILLWIIFIFTAKDNLKLRIGFAEICLNGQCSLYDIVFLAYKHLILRQLRKYL